jgi:putative redox protein
VTTTRHIARAIGVTSAWAPQWRVELESGGHHLLADEPTNLEGGDAGPTPFGLVCGLAACTATTLRHYAARKGWPLETMEVTVLYDVVDGERTSIIRTITVPPELTEDRRTRLAEIAERTPVTKAIRAGTPITTTLRAVEPPPTGPII